MNELDDLLNSVFGSRTIRTSGQAGAQKSGGDAKKPASAAQKQAASRPAGAQTQRPAAQPKQPAQRGTAQPRQSAAASGKNSLEDIEKRAAAARRELEALEQAAPKTGKALDDAIQSQRRQIEALEEVRRIGRDINEPDKKKLADPPRPRAEEKTAPLPTDAAPRGEVGLEGFTGLAAAIEKTVLGQDEYIKKLVIALKRPYVMGQTGESARSAFLVTGPAETGKRLSLCTAAKALCEAGVFVSEDVAWVDLSLYPTAAEEKLFLQDLYAALAAKGDMIVFEGYERCHPALLTVLANLVERGKSPLAGRYVMQNGRLIDAGTALVTDAVGCLTPRGKYLVLLSEAPVGKLADSFGAPFVSALGDVCETQPLTEESLAAVAKAEFDKMRARAEKTLGFTVLTTDAAVSLAAKSGGREKGAGSVLAFWDRAYRALAQYRLEHDEAPESVALDAADGRLTADFKTSEAGENKSTGAVDLLTLLPGAYMGEREAVRAEMERIVGLAEIKEYILRLEDNFAVQARRKEAGLKTSGVSMHMIFTGNPGTGKTTIARLVSKYLKAIGVLGGGQLVEVTRAELVGRYVGHTAPLTSQVVQSAIGGVLFIDEAYSLYRGQDDSFGLEAIDTLVKCMEDHRSDLIVILAGYSKEMEEFLTANSGLKSRFPNIIEFPDYTGEELLAIARIQAENKGYRIDERCDTNLLLYFNNVQMTRARDAGNGRLARNLVEQAVLNQAKRIAAAPDADLSLLLPEDFALEDSSS